MTTLQDVVSFLMGPQSRDLYARTLLGEVKPEAWKMPASELIATVAERMGVDPEVFNGDISGLDLRTELGDEVEAQLESLRDALSWQTWRAEMKRMYDEDEYLDEFAVVMGLRDYLRNPFELTDDELRRSYRDLQAQSQAAVGTFDAMEPYRQVLCIHIEHVARRRSIELL